jgi:CheY-like chemotaxis protein
MTDQRKVLAIDDEETARDFYAASLPEIGFGVLLAASAQEARKVLAKEKPDVILMDIMMPEEDGIGLAREIHSDPRTAAIPIVAVTALSDPATLNDALLFGMSDYIVKPVELDVLKAAIEKAIATAEKRKTRR